MFNSDQKILAFSQKFKIVNILLGNVTEMKYSIYERSASNTIDLLYVR